MGFSEAKGSKSTEDNSNDKYDFGANALLTRGRNLYLFESVFVMVVFSSSKHAYDMNLPF